MPNFEPDGALTAEDLRRAMDYLRKNHVPEPPPLLSPSNPIFNELMRPALYPIRNFVLSSLNVEPTTEKEIMNPITLKPRNERPVAQVGMGMAEETAQQLKEAQSMHTASAMLLERRIERVSFDHYGDSITFHLEYPEKVVDYNELRDEYQSPALEANARVIRGQATRTLSQHLANLAQHLMRNATQELADLLHVSERGNTPADLDAGEDCQQDGCAAEPEPQTRRPVSAA